MKPDDEQPAANRAALYVRMSTEHQQYSTSNQRDVIIAYAISRGLEIVKEYSDGGKSGLNIEGREALAQMIRDVEDGKADYSKILVYDVSRWGRFQDADESAHYEFMCRRAGVAVHYCAEQFENDGSPVSTIVKGVKRMMAGEYNRLDVIRAVTGKDPKELQAFSPYLQRIEETIADSRAEHIHRKTLVHDIKDDDDESE